ncbi:hypothetical protein NXX27_22280 [Bacteroides fragilis]|nr:hypothetical protein [Bacteroides fragilis]
MWIHLLTLQQKTLADWKRCMVVFFEHCYATLDGVDIWDELCTDNAHSHKPWEGNWKWSKANGISTANGYGSYYFGTVRIVNNFIANRIMSCQ